MGWRIFGKDKDGDGQKDGLFGGALTNWTKGKDKDADGVPDGLFGGALKDIFKGKTDEVVTSANNQLGTTLEEFNGTLQDNPIKLPIDWGTFKTESAIDNKTLMIIGGIMLLFIFRKKIVK